MKLLRYDLARGIADMGMSSRAHITLVKVLLSMIYLALFINWPINVQANTLGWLEWGWLEPGAVKIKTKLDTGAKTSSIDAINIEKFKRDGETWVRFIVPLADRPEDSPLNQNLTLVRPLVRVIKVKDHVKKPSTRYVVNLKLCIGGQSFTTPVSLADRSQFNYPLLLGRAALKDRILVDSGKTFTASDSCPPLVEK